MLRPRVFSEHQVAYARFSNRINETGWAELELVTNAHQLDSVQAYYAGYLEGHLTSHLIDSYRKSLGYGSNGDMHNDLCKNYTDFIETNLAAVEHHIKVSEKNRHREEEEDPSKGDYWHEISLTLHQLAGIDDGYSNLSNPKHHSKLSPCGVFLINMADEQEDIDEYIDDDGLPKTDNPGHMNKCSAMVKWLPHQGEVLVAHNTWAKYSSMLRILKKYTFNFSTSKAKSISFSSYPGLVYSDDDFYITSQNLIIQETTIDTYDSGVYDGLEAKNVVMEFIRNVVANRLATSGSQWAKLFSRHNSGTYNNQFMIVDLKELDTKGRPVIKPGFFTVLEQQPNMIRWEDMTDYIRSTGYWASYNVPFFFEIYEYSGFLKQFQKVGDYRSHRETARAKIFAREEASIVNVTSLYHLMRYNDFTKDPMSRCEACSPPYSSELTIAARSDLNDPKGKYSENDLKFSLSGAIDAKVTSSQLAKHLEFVAVSGPTDESQPAFDWSKFPGNEAKHLDQPKVWKFKPLVTKWNDGNNFPNYKFNL